MKFQKPAKSDHHITPQRAFDYAKKEWNIDLKKMYDPCPLHCKFNAFDYCWDKKNFINPPYSKLMQFLSKALSEFKNGNECYLLLPCKTDQRFFQLLLKNKFEIKFFPFRLRFEGHEKPATTPHCLVIMK